MANVFPRPRAAELLEEAAGLAARIDPQSMREVLGWINAYPQMAADSAKIYAGFGAAAAERFPLGPSSRGVLDTTTRVALLVAEGAKEIPPAVLREHEVLIRRYTDPMLNDHLWDIGRGQ